jgi:hypothetical protein
MCPIKEIIGGQEWPPRQVWPAIFARLHEDFVKNAGFPAFFAVAHRLLNLPGQIAHYEDC